MIEIEPPEPHAGVTIPAIIRNETVLSRLPIHTLSKRGYEPINLKDEQLSNVTVEQWDISYSSSYGPPRQLGLKLDKLIINRRVDEARPRGIPKIIRLGSLREICSELELSESGKNKSDIEKALYQNAFTGITAKLRYQRHDGSDQPFKFADTRYGVVFTGEQLPDGTRADAVYIILHDLYRAFLLNVDTRPLDYDYLKLLSSTPAAQRFYELFSYKAFGAMKHRAGQARYLYSEFCTFAPQIRYYQFKRVHMQMKDVHAPHFKSGYLQAVDFHETTDREGKADWEMLYTLGDRAQGEHGKLTGRRSQARRPRRPRQLTLPLTEPDKVIVTPSTPENQKASLPESSNASLPTADSSPEQAAADAATLALAEQLMAHGLGKGAAEIYAQAKPEECRRQLEYLPYVTEFKSSKGAYLRKAIEDGYGPPKGYEAAQAAAAARAKSEGRISAAKARESHEEAHRSAYHAFLGETLAQMETTAQEDYNAFCAWEQKDRLFWKNGPMSKKDYAQERIAIYDEPEERLKRFCRYLEEREKDKKPVLGVPSFWQWDKAHNSQPFQG